MNNADRLKEYVNLDNIYQYYKVNPYEQQSDFDKFCCQHCEDIEEIFEDINFCMKSIIQESKMSTDERTRKEMKECVEVLEKYVNKN